MKLTMLVQGDDLESTAEALTKEISEWDVDFSIRRVHPEEVPDEVRKAVDPVAVASLLISLPSAALAVLDLADRIRKRRRAERLIEKAEQLRAVNQAIAFVVIGGAAVALDTISADELLDLATTPDRSPPP